MASYTSGAVYFSGIGNGTDFSSIVDQLKKVESIPKQRMELWKADWQKRYEAFGYVIDAVRDAKTALSALNSPQKFLLKTGTSSQPGVLSVSASSLAADGTHSIQVKQLASNAIWASNATFATKSASVNTTDAAQDFTYTYKGASRTVSVPKGTTLEGFANLVNQDKNNPGVKVSIIQVSGGYTFQVQGQESGVAADLNIQPSTLFGDDSDWSIRRAEDAIFKVDNWPQDMVSSSNSISNVLEGVTLTLTDIGTSQISVAADTESVKKNIQSVLDALNSVIKTVQELTKYNENKQTASIDTNSNNYSPSQFDREKGSVLTGNYGVQLFNTRLKTLASGSPPGFKSIQGNDIFSGDFIAALSQMGIKTCAEQGDPAYGLFMVAPSGNAQVQEMDMERFEKALSNNLSDVVNFFAADDAGSTTSSSFRYAGHIKGITKAGTYNVSYSVDAGGNPFDVFINGVRANPSDQPGVYTVGQAGGATGMSIVIDDFSPGTHSGQVSIKQGKIRQMEEFFAAELVYYKPDPREPMLGEKNGALMILQANYQQIMDNIDKKIDREQTRLDNWERTQRLAFSRLETLLGNYDRSQQNLTSQLKQLTGE